MSVLNSNSGILEFCHRGSWLAGPQGGSADANPADSVERLIDDLTRVTTVEAAIHRLCVGHLARYGITSWGAGGCSLKFWCHGVDATLRWHVAVNPLDPQDPPYSLLSVELDDVKRRTIYASVVADLHGAGLLLLTHAVLSVIAQALDYDEL